MDRRGRFCTMFNTPAGRTKPNRQAFFAAWTRIHYASVMTLVFVILHFDFSFLFPFFPKPLSHPLWATELGRVRMKKSRLFVVIVYLTLYTNATYPMCPSRLRLLRELLLLKCPVKQILYIGCGVHLPAHCSYSIFNTPFSLTEPD